MLHFYKCYRACVRGKVSCFKLDDPYITPEQRQEARYNAESYFDLACSYVNLSPTLFITAGLTGCGKSTVAKALSKRLGLVVLSSDVVRKKLAGIEAKEHCFEDFNAGIYSPEFSRLTYDTLFAEAGKVLENGESVIIDAAFIKAAERKTAAGIAEKNKAEFFILECKLDEETTKDRLKKRLGESSVSDGRWEVYQEQKGTFETIIEVAPRNHVIIDNINPAEENVKRILTALDDIDDGSCC
jgi:predicted kinase